MTTATPCQWVWMAEALDDGRLRDEDRASFERHVAGCAACRREVENAAWLTQQLEAVPVPSVSDFEHRRERDRLLGRAVRMRLDRGQRTGGRGLWMAAAVACALVAVFVVAGARLAGHHVAGRDSASVPPAPDEPPQYEVTSLAQGAWSTEETGRTARIVLTQGSAAFHVHRLKAGQRFLVTLPDGEIEVRGTRFVVDIENNRTHYVVVMEGKVAFRHAGSPEALLLGGQRWDAPAPGARPPMATMSPEALSAPAAVKVRRTRLHRSAAPQVSPSALAPSASLAPVAPLPDAASRVSPASEQFARAMSIFRAGRYDDADGLLREFIARNPDDPRVEDATFLRMVGCVRRRDPEGAVEMARRYLGQFPNGLRRREAEQVLQAPH